MPDDFRGKILTVLTESLDIPDSAYQAAADRYHDLGEWLGNKSKSKSSQYKPYVSVQGSFRLGTVTRPWKREDYDLDLSCNLQEGISTLNWSQEQLKELVGADLNAYREERGISEKLERKHRCWRLNYRDHIKFHMDTVPCIPQVENVRRTLQQRMIQAGNSEFLARDVAVLAMAITDDRHHSYKLISEDWDISSPEGYAKWFESRMKLAEPFLRSRIMQEKVARVDDLPAYKWKTPLQAAIQILKRHRDIMFEQDPNRKPSSIIITTLAAGAYSGEFDLSAALEQILVKMSVNDSRPRVPNPVNPEEDFADKWGTPEGRRLHLEGNFFAWLAKAKSDINRILSLSDKGALQDQMQKGFGIDLDDHALSSIVSLSSSMPRSPAVHVIRDAPKPWSR